MNSHILIEKNNNILDIKFNRPESRNAITRDMFEQMLTTLENCKEDNELRAIFLSGEGDAFSAGGDVKDMATREDNSSLQEKTNFPFAFFVKFALLFITNIEILMSKSLASCIIKTPVESSAAMPWTAQNIDLNGFLLIHNKFTLTSHVSEVIFSTRTPLHQAEGKLKKVNRLIPLGVSGIFYKIDSNSTYSKLKASATSL